MNTTYAGLAEGDRVSLAVAEMSRVRVWRAEADGTLRNGFGWKTADGKVATADDWASSIHPQDLETITGIWFDAFRKGSPFELLFRGQQADKTYHWYKSNGLPLRGANGDIEEWIGVVQDIQDDLDAADTARVSEERLRLALESGNYGVWDHDLQTGELWGANAVARFIDLPSPIANLEDLLEIVHPDDRHLILSRVSAQGASENPHFRNEFRIIDPKTQSIRWIEAIGTLIANGDNPPTRSLGLIREITGEKIQRQRLEYEARHDPLTGLPNWRSVAAELLALSMAKRSAALILVWIEGLREASELYARNTGWSLLREVADRFRSVLPNGEMIARTSTELAVVVPDASSQTIGAVAERLQDMLELPFEVGEAQVALSAHMGIALLPDDGMIGSELLLSADLALAKAKSGMVGTTCLFTPALRNDARQEHALSAELRQAVRGGEFELFYQPQVRMDDHRIIGLEALLRWHHPQKGMLAPAAFLPVLKKSPMANHLGKWVIEQAARDIAALNRTRSVSEKIRVAVNLFSRQFATGDVAGQIADALASHEVAPDLFEIEVTERVILRNDDGTIRSTLTRLRDLGCPVAFDDFGTGYASLSMLKKFPITRLKIDREFVENLERSPEDGAIVDAVLFLGRTFGLSITAEGIECKTQAAILQERGCEEGQGYLFGRPMPLNEVRTLLGAH
ncbi:putative bifunctional diguanylate cyclase/phosphodiesterase [Tianweitania populi]|uniref:GGDEF domain-containing protein n=1 Tax=Tianweitania populi TaxID=1607949 RepID=A0A8J3DVW8_9HYPH|nr:GGDEF domain-containing phosphodiesterase [Tianweitania populi]GHD11019.1 GGDEF domain-containing protein [Tianweitania populi]